MMPLEQIRAGSLHSSRITLSPKITVSNSSFSINRFKIVRHGLLLAFASNAHTPILPMTLALRSLSFSCASDILSAMVVLDDTEDLFVLRAPVEPEGTEVFCCLVDVVEDGGGSAAVSPESVAREDSFCGAAWTWSPMPSCVKVRAVVGLETTFTGDVAKVALSLIHI